jgi:hypothetical protein
VLSLINGSANTIEEAVGLVRRGDGQQAHDLLYPIPADLRAALKLFQENCDE